MQEKLQKPVMNNINLSVYNGVLRILDFIFHILHIFIIVFFLVGWAFAVTRIAHFVLILLILFSWYGLGIIYGYGYCPITDMQWRIKKVLGQQPHTEYYIKYLIDKITGFDTDSDKINKLTIYSFFAILIVSTICIVNTYFEI
jgi:hypothetical protein